MKKLFITLLAAILFASNTLAYADDSNTVITSEIIHISDNLYVEITLEEEDYSVFSLNRTSTQTKKVSKTASIKSDGTTVATFKLTGTFSYNGSTSSCTSVSHSTSISDDSWEFTSASSSKSGNTATGKYTVKDYFLFVAIQTVSNTITLTCDANGNIS